MSQMTMELRRTAGDLLHRSDKTEADTRTEHDTMSWKSDAAWAAQSLVAIQLKESFKYLL